MSLERYFVGVESNPLTGDNRWSVIDTRSLRGWNHVVGRFPNQSAALEWIRRSYVNSGFHGKIRFHKEHQ